MEDFEKLSVEKIKNQYENKENKQNREDRSVIDKRKKRKTDDKIHLGRNLQSD